jgi:hypothetical protein
MIQTPVGARCPDCAQVRRIPTYNMQPGTYPRAIGAAVVAGLVLGFGWAFFNIITYIFFGLLAGFGIGIVMGEAVSLATNRKRGPPLQVIAAGGVVLAYLVRVGLLLSLTDWNITDLRTDIWGLLVTVLACFVAAGRLR